MSDWLANIADLNTARMIARNIHVFVHEARETAEESGATSAQLRHIEDAATRIEELNAAVVARLLGEKA